MAESIPPDIGRAFVKSKIGDVGNPPRTAGQQTQTVGREDRKPHFQLQIGNNRAQIGVAAAFSYTAKGAVYIHSASLYGKQRVGDSQSAVVVAMDAHRHGQRLANLANDALDLTGHRASVRIAEHHPLGAGIDCGNKRLHRIAGVIAVAVKKVLALENNTLAVFAAIGNTVCDHPQVLRIAGAENRYDLRKAAFTVERDIFVRQRHGFSQQLVFTGSDALSGMWNERRRA